MPEYKVHGSRPTIQIKISGGQIIATGSPRVVANMGMTNSMTNRFDGLLDVVEGQSPAPGAVPVYDANNDKYVVSKLDFDDLVGDIDNVDGGSY